MCSEWTIAEPDQTSVASISVHFDETLKSMAFTLSDGQSVSFGLDLSSNSATEASDPEGDVDQLSESRVDVRAPWQQVVGFQALLDSQERIQNLSVILFDCQPSAASHDSGKSELVRW